MLAGPEAEPDLQTMQTGMQCRISNSVLNAELKPGPSVSLFLFIFFKFLNSFSSLRKMTEAEGDYASAHYPNACNN